MLCCFSTNTASHFSKKLTPCVRLSIAVRLYTGYTNMDTVISKHTIRRGLQDFDIKPYAIQSSSNGHSTDFPQDQICPAKLKVRAKLWKRWEYIASLVHCTQPSFDSSVGRAVDCSGVDTHRSLVRIRLEGFCFVHPAHT